MTSLPRVLIGQIMLHCPDEIIKCIKFLRIWPRVVEILLRPRYVQRRDFEALKIRGTPSDIYKCVATGWVAGAFYLNDKYGPYFTFGEGYLIENGINIYKLSATEKSSVYDFITGDFKTDLCFTHVLMFVRLPVDRVRYWIEHLTGNDLLRFRVCINQNQWDLAEKYVNPSMSISSDNFCHFTVHKACKYIAFCKKHNLLSVGAIEDVFSRISLRKKVYHFLKQCFPEANFTRLPTEPRIIHVPKLANYDNPLYYVVQHPTFLNDNCIKKIFNKSTDKTDIYITKCALIMAGRFKYLFL